MPSRGVILKYFMYLNHGNRMHVAGREYLKFTNHHQPHLIVADLTKAVL